MEKGREKESSPRSGIYSWKTAGSSLWTKTTLIQAELFHYHYLDNILHFSNDNSSSLQIFPLGRTHLVDLFTINEYRLSTAESTTMRSFFIWFFASIFILTGAVYAQQDSVQDNSEKNTCFPSVTVFEAGSHPKVFCLNNYTPSGSYCLDLQMVFRKSGIGVRFHCNKQNMWSFEGSGYEKEKPFVPVNVEVTRGNEGQMRSISVFLGINPDSVDIDIVPRFSGDRMIKTDSLQHLGYTINQRKYLCIDKPEYKVITDRQFTYPAGYMRRGPQLNYPELHWFHHGPGVAMPASASVRERGELVVLYNILNPPDLKYDDMKQEIKKEAWKNQLLNKRWQEKMIRKEEERKKNPRKFKRRRKKKESWLKIKPLR